MFELQLLKQCRLHLKLGLMFKIIHHLCYFPSIPAFQNNISNLKGSHLSQLDPSFARTNAYKFSFFPHTMLVWNSLSDECVTSTSYPNFMETMCKIYCFSVLYKLCVHLRLVYVLLCILCEAA